MLHNLQFTIESLCETVCGPLFTEHIIVLSIDNESTDSLFTLPFITLNHVQTLFSINSSLFSINSRFTFPWSLFPVLTTGKGPYKYNHWQSMPGHTQTGSVLGYPNPQAGNLMLGSKLLVTRTKQTWNQLRPVVCLQCPPPVKPPSPLPWG